MAVTIVPDQLWQVRTTHVILDVRTPSEYAHGHIPGAINLPLFSDEERSEIGTTYKQRSPEAAILQGLDYAGPKMKSLVMQARKLRKGRPLVVHCWRGGKRSESVAWLLDFAGLDVSVLQDGYKGWRRYVHQMFNQTPHRFIVLGGKTGCGKTEILKTLESQGEQVIDLEQIAHHKGSAFGWIGEAEQPSVEQFENLLYDAIRALDPKRPIWIENESKGIGRVFIPDGLWARIKQSVLINVEADLDSRIERLLQMYQLDDDQESLIASFQKIKKRLGGQHLKAALEALETNNFGDAARIALHYYDKAYEYNLSINNAPQIFNLDIRGKDISEAAHMCLALAKNEMYASTS